MNIVQSSHRGRGTDDIFARMYNVTLYQNHIYLVNQLANTNKRTALNYIVQCALLKQQFYIVYSTLGKYKNVLLIFIKYDVLYKDYL